MTSALKRTLFQIYAHVKYPEALWRLVNGTRVALFEKNRPTLNAVQERVLKDLRETGIAQTSLEELFPGENMLEKLQAYATERAPHAVVNHKKPFLMDYWPETKALDPSNPFLQLVLSPKLVDVANSYLGMFTTMIDYNLQKTVVAKETRTHSQNWHRDPQERRLCKVFVYLNDIGPDNGPFVYIPRSVRGLKYGNLYPQQLPAGVYPDGADLESRIPESDRVAMMGKAGTLTFCDTTGLHYGGVVREGHRMMSTLVFGAASYRENQMYWYDEATKEWIVTLPLASRSAIRTEWEKKR